MRAAVCLLPLLLAACQPGGGSDVPGDSADTRPFAGIAPDETIRFTGTEPFWSGEVDGETLVWKTPEKPDGDRIAITRFPGRGGLSISGRAGDAGLDMTVTPGACSDGMSDRRYPFVVTVRRGDAVLEGCGWTERQGWTGPEAP